MSRIAKSPIDLPAGVEVKISGQDVSVKGSKGNLDVTLNAAVNIKQNDNVLNFEPKNAGRTAWAQAGTARALVANMVKGVSQGFERRLTLIGVGYRTNVKGSTVNLTLGFSHPVEYQLPEGITAEAPSQTELIIRGSDKQKVGQVCAEIRAFRPPEPYKGKGVRYSDENVRRKEAKKK